MKNSCDYLVGDPRRVQAVVGEITGALLTEPLSSGGDPDKINRASRVFAEGGWIVLILSEWGAGRHVNLRGATEGTRVPFYVGDFYIAKYPPGARTIRGNFLFDIVAEPELLLPLSYVFFSLIEFRFNAGFIGIDLLTETEIDDTRQRLSELVPSQLTSQKGLERLLRALDQHDQRVQ